VAAAEGVCKNREKVLAKNMLRFSGTRINTGESFPLGCRNSPFGKVAHERAFVNVILIHSAAKSDPPALV